MPSLEMRAMFIVVLFSAERIGQTVKPFQKCVYVRHTIIFIKQTHQKVLSIAKQSCNQLQNAENEKLHSCVNQSLRLLIIDS